jgi:hypothetical protein
MVFYGVARTFSDSNFYKGISAQSISPTLRHGLRRHWL